MSFIGKSLRASGMTIQSARVLPKMLSTPDCIIIYQRSCTQQQQRMMAYNQPKYPPPPPRADSSSTADALQMRMRMANQAASVSPAAAGGEKASTSSASAAASKGVAENVPDKNVQRAKEQADGSSSSSSSYSSDSSSSAFSSKKRNSSGASSGLMFGFLTGLVGAGGFAYYSLMEDVNKSARAVMRRMDELQRTSEKVSTSLQKIYTIERELQNLKNNAAIVEDVRSLRADMENATSALEVSLAQHRSDVHSAQQNIYNLLEHRGILKTVDEEPKQ